MPAVAAKKPAKHTEANKDPVAEDIISRNDSMKSTRASWDTLWQSLADYIQPRKSQITTKKTEAVEGFTDEIYDNTAEQSNMDLAAGQLNYLTPSNERWSGFEAPEAVKARGGDIAEKWYAQCSEIAFRFLAASNFYLEIHEFYLDRGGFGTTALHCEEGKRTRLNFAKLDVGTFSVAEDDEGMVDTVFREFQLTARQAVQKFGIENVGEKIRQNYETDQAKKLDEKFTFIHAIYPRIEDDRMPGKWDGPNKPIASVYVCKEDRYVVRNSGYDEMPTQVSRYLKWGDAPYGYCPAITALPTVKQVNFLEKNMDALAEIAAFPRILQPEDLDGEVDMRAAGITIFDPNKPNSKPEVWGTEGRYDIGKERIDTKQKAIERAFHVDLFRMFASVDKQMTAYEAMQRVAEKLVQFSPTFSRLTTETLNPLLQRVFGILFRAGEFPEPPPEVLVPTADGVQLAQPEVVYTSRVALAIKALENRSFIEFMQIIGPLVQLRPDILDNFDLDEAARLLAKNLSLPTKIMRDKDDVAEDRTARAQAAAQAAAPEQAATMAKAAKDASAADPAKLGDFVAGLSGAGAAAR
jgi:hypothetical protein